MDSTRTKKRAFTDRLDLDGVREYFNSAKKIEKAFWFLVTIFSYMFAIYLSYLTALRFGIGKKIVFSKHNPPTDNVHFPVYITLCQTTFWNRTYVEENIRVPEFILEKASKIGLSTKSHVLSEFAKYMSYYNLIHFEDEANIREDVWNLMTELYEHTFSGLQFSEIVQDAVIRSSVVKCWFRNRRYQCDRAMPLSVDSPSCMMVPVQYGHQSEVQWDNIERAEVRFDVTLPIEHTFHADSNTSESGIENLGLKILLTASPTPFDPQWAAPPNTHAFIVYHHKEQLLLRSDCVYFETSDYLQTVDPEFHWPKTYATCLATVFEVASRNICGCRFIAGTYYPDNSLICSPDTMRKCVQRNLSQALVEDEDPPFQYDKLKRQCKQNCWSDTIIASITYYNLDDIPSDHIRNVITVRPNLDLGIQENEKDLTNIYGAFSEVGGVIGIYTGLSIAAVVRVLALIVGAGLRRFNHRTAKPFLATWMSDTPLSVRWDLMSILHYRRGGRRSVAFGTKATF